MNEVSKRIIETSLQRAIMALEKSQDIPEEEEKVKCILEALHFLYIIQEEVALNDR